VTAVGSSDFGLLQTVTFLVRNPLEIFPRLAEKMPTTTHFYLEYLVVQCSVQALNITRYWVLGHYYFSFIQDKELARKEAEPEDQAYYGIGSLSARSTLNLTIALVFCTLTPIICVVATVVFFIARLVHVYLSIYAETRKPDIGGDYFFRQLLHTQQSLFLYITLMTGVLTKLSDSWVPSAISALSFWYLMVSYNRFKREGRSQMSRQMIRIYNKDNQKVREEEREHMEGPMMSPAASSNFNDTIEAGPKFPGQGERITYKQPEVWDSEMPDPMPAPGRKSGSDQWRWLNFDGVRSMFTPSKADPSSPTNNSPFAGRRTQQHHPPPEAAFGNFQAPDPTPHHKTGFCC